MSYTNKKVGPGSLSLLLCIIGILFSFSFKNKGAYGDDILNFIGLQSWSNGDTGIHYTVFYSLIFFITSISLGYKYKKNLGAKLGKTISLVISILIILVSIFFMPI